MAESFFLSGPGGFVARKVTDEPGVFPVGCDKSLDGSVDFFFKIRGIDIGQTHDAVFDSHIVQLQHEGLPVKCHHLRGGPVADGVEPPIFHSTDDQVFRFFGIGGAVAPEEVPGPKGSGVGTVGIRTDSRWRKFLEHILSLVEVDGIAASTGMDTIDSYGEKEASFGINEPPFAIHFLGTKESSGLGFHRQVTPKFGIVGGFVGVNGLFFCIPLLAELCQ